MPEVDSIPTWAGGGGHRARSRRAASRCRRRQSMDRSPVAGIRPSWRRARAPLRRRPFDRRGAREGDGTMSRQGQRGDTLRRRRHRRGWVTIVSQAAAVNRTNPPPPPYDSGGRDYLQRGWAGGRARGGNSTEGGGGGDDNSSFAKMPPRPRIPLYSVWYSRGGACPMIEHDRDDHTATTIARPRLSQQGEEGG